MRYYLSLSNDLGEALHSVVFLTHVPNYIGSSDGHWIAVEHNLALNVITLWDSLSGSDYEASFQTADNQIRRQWVVANLVRLGRTCKVCDQLPERILSILTNMKDPGCGLHTRGSIPLSREAESDG